MLDHRSTQTIDLSDTEVLKENVAYKYIDKHTKKELVVKLIDGYNDEEDKILIAEFRKLMLLSSEPEIGTVYFLAKTKLQDLEKSCYVMDFIEGYDLDQFIGSQDYINYDVIFNIIIQIGSGLEKAHHYDIFHNDLHNKNVRINTLGYVKLIDFLWRELYKEKQANILKDLNDFKRIVEELSAKCESSMSSKMSMLKDFCQGLSSFTNLQDKLTRINNILFDLSLLGENSLAILSALVSGCKTLPPSILLHSVQKIDEVIPAIYITARTPAEDGYLEANRKVDKETQQIESGEIPKPFLRDDLKYNDTRISKIKHIIDYQLLILLEPIERAGFIKFNVDIVNKGEAFIGPYHLMCSIYFTSKYVLLNEINKSTLILKALDKDLEELILGTPVSGLQGYLAPEVIY